MEKNLSVCCIEAQRLCSLSYEKELQEKDEEIKFLKASNAKLEEARVAHLTSCEEKDAEIDRLKEKFKAERNDVLYMDKRVLEEKERYQEVVNDIAYLEDIASTLLLLGEKNTKTTRMMQAIRTKYGLNKQESKE